MDDLITPTAPDPTASEVFRRWAMTLFALLLVFIVIAVALIGPAVDGRPPLEGLLAGIGATLGVAAVVSFLVGLDRGYPWAIPAAIIACWVLVLAAVVHVLVDLTRSTITIPLEGIAAAAVLTRRPAALPTAAAGDRRLAIVLSLLFITAEAWPLLTDAVHRGQMFGVSRDALTLTTTLDCSQVRDVTGGGPDRVIVATTTWAWAGWEPWPGGVDGMVVQWAGGGETADGEPSDLVIIDDDTERLGPGIGRGIGSPAAGLLQDALAVPGVEVGIDVGTRGLHDGTVTATLVTGHHPAPQHGSVQFWVDYAHLDRWRITGGEAACDW